MVLALLSLSIGYTDLFVAIRSQLRGVVGRIGLALLVLGSLAMLCTSAVTGWKLARNPA